MISIRAAKDRFHTQFNWLDSWHAFSFGDHYDPANLGFGDLIVINDDRIAPGGGFGKHGHRDMEIITYVLEGELKHEDSLGTGSIIKSGEVQRMSAGKGIIHSEFNPSSFVPLHLLQIWILTADQGITPEYEQKEFLMTKEHNRLHLVASPDGREGSLTIHQDAFLFAGVLDRQTEVAHALMAGRHAWVQVARGSIVLNGIALAEGDGAAITDETRLTMQSGEEAEVLLFDLN